MYAIPKTTAEAPASTLSDAPHDRIAEAVRTILSNVGEDPEREGLVRTPERVARMYDELLAGYSTSVEELVNGALFEEGSDEPVIVADIEYHSLCEHHMLPFHGVAHIAYVPNRKVIGLSKIPRIVELFARRLQVQERMTKQIADLIEEVLEPRGVAVVMLGHHMCGSMRGIKKHGVSMVTRAMRGVYREDATLRREFTDQVLK